MHRDQKVGLALSVLLIGFVAAFFFRNERGVDSESAPQLKNQQEIDDQIAKRTVTPYLSNVEDVDASKVMGSKSNEQQSQLQHWELPDFLKQTGDSAPSSAAVVTGPTPEPIAVLPPSASSDQIDPIPPHNAAWEVGSRKPPPAESDGSRNGIIYLVQDGDTLSQLARRFLGNSIRFKEIHEANRDVIRTPNDLRAGMTIRIPISTESSPSTDRSQQKKFRPSRQHPLGTVRQRDAGRSTAKERRPVKRLSQTPPKHLSNDALFETDVRRPQTPGATPTANQKSVKDATSRQRLKSPQLLYEIQRGDTLERIAIKFYGTRKAAQKVFDANRKRLTNQHTIREGMTIVIP